jgi:hypothetical protein
MSYGGPAIMGIMQTKIQEKRPWIEKLQFVKGLALVNMLPGPGVTQFGIFLGHAKAGLAGGIIAGVCFIVPAFLMLALAAVWDLVRANDGYCVLYDPIQLSDRFGEIAAQLASERGRRCGWGTADAGAHAVHAVRHDRR